LKHFFQKPSYFSICWIILFCDFKQAASLFGNMISCTFWHGIFSADLLQLKNIFHFPFYAAESNFL